VVEASDNDGRGALTLQSQISRLRKYVLEKGFDLILPKLSIEKLPTRNLKYMPTEALELPIMVITYDKVEANKIMCTNILTADMMENGKKTEWKTPSSRTYSDHDANVGAAFTTTLVVWCMTSTTLLFMFRKKRLLIKSLTFALKSRLEWWTSHMKRSKHR
jgi:hypothetical protein